MHISIYKPLTFPGSSYALLWAKKCILSSIQTTFSVDMHTRCTFLVIYKPHSQEIPLPDSRQLYGILPWFYAIHYVSCYICSNYIRRYWSSNYIHSSWILSKWCTYRKYNHRWSGWPVSGQQWPVSNAIFRHITWSWGSATSKYYFWTTWETPKFINAV